MMQRLQDTLTWDGDSFFERKICVSGGLRESGQTLKLEKDGGSDVQYKEHTEE
ncbi:MAG: hypothetical protein LBD44_06845 [Spirochaetaceae bacterium]|jgi:hypothetical protein|nr:hypothetical protein [Spirochaetaceae bacterium]